MADGSSIEWTDATWNPIRARRLVPVETGGEGPTVLTERKGWYCEHVSPGCARCYAERFNAWVGTRLAYKPAHRDEVEIFLDEKILMQPLGWKRPRNIFLLSMSDLFGRFVTDEMIDRVFAVMAQCHERGLGHIFQVLTKRGDRMRAYFADDAARKRGIRAAYDTMGLREVWLPTWPIPSVWLGVSVEDQQRADERREDFRAVPAAVKFVSYEPALGGVDWAGWEFVDWIISGGESGAGARPSHPDWHRAARDFCAVNGIAYFFKQWGEWASDYDRDLDDPDWRRCAELLRTRPKGRWLNLAGGHGFHGERVVFVDRVGKKAAGSRLDGATHDAMPGAAR